MADQERFKVLCVLAMLFVVSLSYGQNREAEQPLDERIAELERAVASLETQLVVRTPEPVIGPSSGDMQVERRLAELERNVDRLLLQLQRTEQAAQSAQRDASQALRTAQAAERAAMNAARR